MTIGTLTCRITLKGKEGKSPTFQDAAPKNVDLQFRAAPSKAAQTPTTPAESATGEEGRDVVTRENKPRVVADPHRVADRVYELIKDEIRNGRLRQGRF